MVGGELMPGFHRKKKKKKEEVMGSKNVPTNKALYSRVKAAAKKKFKVYPSAYDAIVGWSVSTRNEGVDTGSRRSRVRRQSIRRRSDQVVL